MEKLRSLHTERVSLLLIFSLLALMVLLSRSVQATVLLGVGAAPVVVPGPILYQGYGYHHGYTEYNSGANYRGGVYHGGAYRGGAYGDTYHHGGTYHHNGTTYHHGTTVHR